MGSLLLILLAMLFCSRIDLSLSAATCEEAFLEGSTSTGVKTLQSNGYSFKAFCLYNGDGTGWFYPSTEAVKDNGTFTLNLFDQYTYRDQARLRIFLNHGGQKDSTIQQMSAYNYRNLTFMVNSAAGFANPHNTGKYSPNYLYVGFLDKNTARARNVQGWKADGRDITFRNCDGTPNSYYVFYPTTTYSSRPRGLGKNFHTTNVWRGGVNRHPGVRRENSIPTDEVDNFKFSVEIHMGGCGTMEVSTDWNSKRRNRLRSNGAALGLKFAMSDECSADPCGSHGTCVDGVKSFTCQCEDGWTGKTCTQKTSVIHRKCGGNPCQNGGTCVNVLGVYMCNCYGTGHRGSYCQQAEDTSSLEFSLP